MVLGLWTRVPPRTLDPFQESRVPRRHHVQRADTASKASTISSPHEIESRTVLPLFQLSFGRIWDPMYAVHEHSRLWGAATRHAMRDGLK